MNYTYEGLIRSAWFMGLGIGLLTGLTLGAALGLLVCVWVFGP